MKSQVLLIELTEVSPLHHRAKASVSCGERADKRVNQERFRRMPNDHF